VQFYLNASKNSDGKNAGFMAEKFCEALGVKSLQALPADRWDEAKTRLVDAIEGKRVIWRTCGQSDPRLEVAMSRYRAEGLQVVRYSPKEREAFGRMGAFAGEDAMIRFGKDPDEWTGWHGSDAVVGNITQHMAQRGNACGFDFWDAATRDLPAQPAGPGSEALDGGLGQLDYETMREYLRRIRVYVYTGTRPASYTLGLMEAMLTGVPVVAMGAAAFEPRDLWEAHNITLLGFDGPEEARRMVRNLLGDKEWAAGIGRGQQLRARELFGLERIMGQWADFLGVAS
jgi:hypothetical protein